MIPNSLVVNKPVALIGIAEKGYAVIELGLQGEGGHASMPGQHTLVGDLGTVIGRLQSQPMPARLSPPTRVNVDVAGTGVNAVVPAGVHESMVV